jgi:hypothetical protein
LKAANPIETKQNSPTLVLSSFTLVLPPQSQILF